MLLLIKYLLIIITVINVITYYLKYITLLTNTTAAQNEAALSYHKLRGIYF